LADKNSALALLRQVETTGSLVVRGYSQLQTVRQAISLALKQSGYEITFDPESHPELVDYLTVSGMSGLEGAATGALIGSLLGTLFKRPGLGAALGAGVGAAAGVMNGVNRVDQGWRIKAIRAPDQTPVITINAVRTT